MSFFKFTRSVLGALALAEGAAHLVDKANASSRKAELVAALKKYAAGFKDNSELSEVFRVKVEQLYADLSQEEVADDTIGEAFLSFATISYLVANDYQEVLPAKMAEALIEDEFGDVDTARSVKVVERFLETRLEALIDLSKGILPISLFAAVRHPSYTAGLLLESNKQVWASFIGDLIAESMSFHLTDELPLEVAVEGFDVLEPAFAKKGWALGAIQEFGRVQATLALREDQCYMVIYLPGDDDISREEIRGALGVGYELVEEGECAQVLIFSEDEALIDSLDYELGDEFLCSDMEIASDLIAAL